MIRRGPMKAATKVGSVPRSKSRLRVTSVTQVSFPAWHPNVRYTIGWHPEAAT